MIDRRQITLVAIVAGVIVLSVIGVYAIIDSIAAGPGRRPVEIWEIPGGYKGLIVAHFGVAECPPTPRRDGRLVHAVGLDGTFCSSELLAEGGAVDIYEYVYPDGHRTTLRYGDEVAKLIVRGRVEPDPSADLFIFVGTPDEQRKAHENLPRS
ncbi:MAG: hypothetical protein M3P38_09385 [Chloroflexota bacterium]|nr:hypothetical protein [Chloroflexota bacterium]